MRPARAAAGGGLKATAVIRPLLVDLFCGAGGAAMGYHRAGFDLLGVDQYAALPVSTRAGHIAGGVVWGSKGQRLWGGW